MSQYVRLTALPLFALLAISVPSIAQQDGDSRPTISMMPLRADEIVVDAERGSVLLRGSIDWPDGRTTTSIVIICYEKGPYIAVQDLKEKTDDRWGGIDPDFCNQLVKRVQPRR